jgi:tRNA-modifying protein YgfZ
MMALQDLHRSKGATLAQDGIPLHYGDLLAEYNAALNTAVMLDRSHEGRIQLFGNSRFELLNRISTNKMVAMATSEGRATMFLNPNARILDRISAYNRADHLLLITDPGRGDAFAQFLQRNIFFNDDARLVNITSQTAQFAIHGVHADAVMAALAPETANLAPLHSIEITVGDATIFAARRKEISGGHWLIMVAVDKAEMVYETILHVGKTHGLTPAGSLTYNTLRIRAGHPARPELNTDYIPLEVGLWDEVHFAKGCYTGQEIIARMESRAKLAKTIVALEMSEFVEAPADVRQDGHSIGKMTSSVQAPTGEIFAIAIIKTQATEIGTPLTVGEVNQPAVVKGLLGEQPAYIK